MEKLKEKIKGLLAGKKITADVYIEESRKTETMVNDGRVERVLNADSFGLGLRIFKDTGMGFGFSTVKDAAEAEKLIDKVNSSALIEGYEKYSFPAQIKLPVLPIEDPEYGSLTMKKRQETAFEIEAAAKNSSPKVKYVRDTFFSDTATKISLFNTGGADYSYSNTYYFAFTGVVASDGGPDEAAEGTTGNVLFREIDAKKLGDDTGRRAAGLTSATPVKSGKYSLIIPPSEAASLLQVIAPMFYSSNVRKGKSLLKNYKEGDLIGPALLNITDNAVMDYHIGSFPIDAEGEAGREKALVKDGKFMTLLYDRQNGALLKKSSTGNSVRQSYKTLPDAGESNFYIKPTADRADDIMKKEKGIFVNSMMGLHMTDVVSGNFSLGINGWVVENGEKGRPVKEILITGNIVDFLRSISAVADDLKFYFNFGSPTLVVRDIQVAGK